MIKDAIGHLRQATIWLHLAAESIKEEARVSQTEVSPQVWDQVSAAFGTLACLRGRLGDPTNPLNLHEAYQCSLCRIPAERRGQSSGQPTDPAVDQYPAPVRGARVRSGGKHRQASVNGSTRKTAGKEKAAP